MRSHHRSRSDALCQLSAALGAAGANGRIAITWRSCSANSLAPTVDDRARMFLGYALAKELDDLKRYDEAFQYLAAARGFAGAISQYDVALDQRKLQRIEAVFPRVIWCVRRPQTAGSSRFIFIVGLPRSGTTLLEHMLMGLAGVRSNGETENFSQALLAAAPRDRGDVFAGAAAADPNAVVADGYARWQVAKCGMPGCHHRKAADELSVPRRHPSRAAGRKAGAGESRAASTAASPCIARCSARPIRSATTSTTSRNTTPPTSA